MALWLGQRFAKARHDAVVTDPDEDGLGQRDSQARLHVQGEPRWPMAAAVLVSVAMQLWLPDRHVLSPSVLFPTVEVLLLVVLVIGDPGRI